MKLRIFVLLLALANVALFAWGWTTANDAQARSASGPLARQIRPDAVRITPPSVQQPAQ